MTTTDPAAEFLLDLLPENLCSPKSEPGQRVEDTLVFVCKLCGDDVKRSKRDSHWLKHHRQREKRREREKLANLAKARKARGRPHATQD